MTTITQAAVSLRLMHGGTAVSLRLMPLRYQWYGQKPDAPRVHRIHLVVEALDAVRATLLGNDVKVSGVQDIGGGVRYAYFSDPDGNSWALQEITR